jgi:hypothetical protein
METNAEAKFRLKLPKVIQRIIAPALQLPKTGHICRGFELCFKDVVLPRLLGCTIQNDCGNIPGKPGQDLGHSDPPPGPSVTLNATPTSCAVPCTVSVTASVEPVRQSRYDWSGCVLWSNGGPTVECYVRAVGTQTETVTVTNSEGKTGTTTVSFTGYAPVAPDPLPIAAPSVDPCAGGACNDARVSISPASFDFGLLTAGEESGATAVFQITNPSSKVSSPVTFGTTIWGVGLNEIIPDSANTCVNHETRLPPGGSCRFGVRLRVDTPQAMTRVDLSAWTDDPMTSATAEMTARVLDAPALDQNLGVKFGNLGVMINGAYSTVAQTYTAGVTGVLREVAVDIFPSALAPLRVSIRGVTDGRPNADILGEVLLDRAGSQLSQRIVFPEFIAQESGSQYAIAVDCPGVAPSGLGNGTWAGEVNDQYPAGRLFGSSDGQSWADIGPGFDVHFQTFVAPPTGP